MRKIQGVCLHLNKAMKLSHYEETWHDMSSSGRLAREVSEYTDLGQSSASKTESLA